MPRDSSGTYSLPDGYLAIGGETIQPSQHNPPLEDIAQALTGSLPRNGSAPMLAPLKASDGSASAPSLAFNSAVGTGFYLVSPTVIGLAIGGVLVAQFTSNGLAGTVQPGSGIDFWGPTAPIGWLFAYGQNVSRTTYAVLWAALGSPNTGDGSTTFTMPDKRGRSSFGKDDMGGTSANRITNQSGGWNGDTLGAAGGSETHQLTIAQLPQTTPTGTAASAGTLSGTTGLIKAIGVQLGSGATVYGPNAGIGSDTSISVSVSDTARSLSINPFGSNGAHNNLPPGISCNYIIYAGV
jgi:microcystin-dependent protein